MVFFCITFGTHGKEIPIGRDPVRNTCLQETGVNGISSMEPVPDFFYRVLVAAPRLRECDRAMLQL